MSNATESQIKPVRDYLTVRIVPEGMSDGGIALPEGVRLKNRSRVVAVGEGFLSANGVAVPMACKPGDYVIAFFPPGTPVIERDPELGDLLLCRYEHVLAVDERPATVTTIIEAPRLVQ